MTYDDVIALGEALPGVEQSMAYGTPCLRVKGKYLCGRRNDGTLSIRIPSRDERDMLVAIDPEVYLINDHYLTSSYVMMRLEVARPDQVEARLRAAWRHQAPKRFQALHPEV